MWRNRKHSAEHLQGCVQSDRVWLGRTFIYWTAKSCPMTPVGMLAAMPAGSISYSGPCTAMVSSSGSKGMRMQPARAVPWWHALRFANSSSSLDLQPHRRSRHRSAYWQGRHLSSVRSIPLGNQMTCHSSAAPRMEAATWWSAAWQCGQLSARKRAARGEATLVGGALLTPSHMLHARLAPLAASIHQCLPRDGPERNPSSKTYNPNKP